MKYTNRELQAVMIAKMIDDKDIVVVGTGLPLVGATLAKKTYAPDCILILESGLIDCDPVEVPTSVADLRLMQSSKIIWEQYRYFGLQSNWEKYDDINLVSFIGGAQIDMYGNLNSTSIGDYKKPKIRLTGSGGANGIATFFNTIIMMQHEKRRFVNEVDYLTSPGWKNNIGTGSDKKLASNGPIAVVTDLGIIKFDKATKKMYLSEIFPGIDLEEISKNTSFKLDTSRAIVSREPEKDVLEVLRREVDPLKVFI